MDVSSAIRRPRVQTGSAFWCDFAERHASPPTCVALDHEASPGARVRKRITVVMPCFNEEGNVREAYEQVKAVFAAQPAYEYEHLFIDNASTDGTVAILRELAAADPRVQVIVNARNFGHIRSPFYGLLQGHGDAVIILASDLQDPPSLIPDFLARWEGGSKICIGVKESSEETFVMFMLRTIYYRLVGRLSDVPLVQHMTGFGLYDQRVIEILRSMNDPYPYFRGLICDIGFERSVIKYRQPLRKRGLTKNNFYTLYDMAVLGITNHSKVPLRLAAMAGFVMSAGSFLIALGFLIAKLLFWYRFPIGTAPLQIGVFFMASVQLFFIGVLGEYVGSIHTQVLKRPLVIELERINC